MNGKKRETELDLLRVLATFVVIFTHTPEGDVPLPDGHLVHVLFTAFRLSICWAVPAFVMISGRFFLEKSRNVTVYRLWTGYIPRLLCAFCFWSAVYQLYYHIIGLTADYTLPQVLAGFVIGNYHMWFIYMIIVMYMLTPLLRPIACDQKLCAYYLLLFFIVSFLDSYGRDLPKIGWTVKNVLSSAHADMLIGYTGYFLLGSFLRQIQLDRRKERLFYLLGAGGFAFSCFAQAFLPIPEGEDFSYYSEYLRPNVILAAAAIYYFFCRKVSQHSFSQASQSLIFHLSGLSFGIYLSHVMILDLLTYLKYPWISMTPFLHIPSTALISFVMGAGLTWFIKRIPKLGKILV
ncbi:MAG: acyltransferase [Oscillospiraceae bacterium]|nr:acyltransferase [Oscillospiraceae bacterium]